jgi:hypothetical protein
MHSLVDLLMTTIVWLMGIMIGFAFCLYLAQHGNFCHVCTQYRLKLDKKERRREELRNEQAT